MRPLRSVRRRPSRGAGASGLHYDARFLSAGDRASLATWVETLQPLWEQRYSAHHPPPPGRGPRALLRPVYWLGNWQFACLDYYRPPHGVDGRCVQAEPFPPVLRRLADQIERLARELFPPADVPEGFCFNTCLVNFYGDRVEEGRREDLARVGEHKDFEPGPVGSLSLGERALFQFVRSQRPGERDQPALQLWLEDGSLQLFAGDRFKKHLFHRVQRVERKGSFRFARHLAGFETRRVNLTLRHVPDRHVTRFRALRPEDRDDLRGYVAELARSSPFWAAELAAEARP